MNEIIWIALRSVIVYVFIVLAIRLFGKKELTQLSIIDLVFILLISNSVQNAMVGGNSTLLGGIAAAGGLFVANYILKNIFFHSEKLSEVFQGSPLMLVYQGKINQKHLTQAQISHEELEAAVREHGVENVHDVDLAVLEVDGNISVLSHNFQQKTIKKRRIHKLISRSS